MTQPYARKYSRSHAAHIAVTVIEGELVRLETRSEEINQRTFLPTVIRLFFIDSSSLWNTHLQEGFLREFSKIDSTLDAF